MPSAQARLDQAARFGKVHTAGETLFEHGHRPAHIFQPLGLDFGNDIRDDLGQFGVGELCRQKALDNGDFLGFALRQFEATALFIKGDALAALLDHRLQHLQDLLVPDAVGDSAPARRDIAITTDIIVGFPGETEADFMQTVEMVEQVEYDAMFIFKYSKRPNTPALQYEDQIPEEEKTRRFNVLQERQRAVQMKRNARYVGTTHQVHVEGYNMATSQWIGKTTQHKTLNFVDADIPAPLNGQTLVGQYMDVLVTRSSPNSLAGERVGRQ